MNRFLKLAYGLAVGLGLLLALPGFLLLLAAGQIQGLRMERAESERQQALNAECM